MHGNMNVKIPVLLMSVCVCVCVLVSPNLHCDECLRLAKIKGVLMKNLKLFNGYT